MRLRIIATLVFVASLLLAVAGSACDLGGDGGGASGAMLDMMKRVPEDVTAFMFYDAEGILADDDWADMFEEDWDMSDSGIDVDTDDVDAFAIATTTTGDYGGFLMLLEGSFDSDAVAEGLEDEGFSDDTYNRVDIWEMELYTDYVYWVALWDDLLIYGFDDDVKDCVDVIEDGEDSLYDNDDFKDAADRIGDGLFAALTGEEEAAAQYDGGEVFGMSFDAKDSDTAKVKGVLIFEDEDAADEAMEDIEDDLDDEDWQDVDVDQSGRIIEASGEIDLSDVGFE